MEFPLSARRKLRLKKYEPKSNVTIEKHERKSRRKKFVKRRKADILFLFGTWVFSLFVFSSSVFSTVYGRFICASIYLFPLIYFFVASLTKIQRRMKKIEEILSMNLRLLQRMAFLYVVFLCCCCLCLFVRLHENVYRSSHENSLNFVDIWCACDT